MLTLLGSIAGIALALLKWYLDPNRRRGKAIKKYEAALKEAMAQGDMEKLTQIVSEILDRSRRAGR